ncbi:MAG: M3 family oligoendopeptidase, partial [Firmicutes bacterium]|nr:M3 family oligoendopeptidase [Bacillota bacterium]
MTVEFYTPKVDLQDTDRISAMLDELLAADLRSAEDVEAWLARESQVRQDIEDALSVDYIQFQRFSDQEMYRARFEHNEEVVQPLLKNAKIKLDSKFVSAARDHALDSGRYGTLIRRRENAAALFCEANIALEVQESRLMMKYSELTGAMTVEWDGVTKTLAEMLPFLEVTDRTVRERAWRTIETAWDAVAHDLGAIMDALVPLRHRIAVNAGFANYRDYMFRKLERFDYTPAYCVSLHEAMRSHAAPLLRRMWQHKAQTLGLARLRPWDVHATPPGNTPLQPFATADELISRVTRMLARLDDAFADVLGHMQESGLLDLQSRPGKVPGGFESGILATDEAFIFMNAAGVHWDMTTLVHESGHAVHSRLSGAQELIDFKNVPSESAELASQGMELLTLDKWDECYGPTDHQRAIRHQMSSIVEGLIHIAIVDEFQHWMYEHPTHTNDERLAKFAELVRSYGQEEVDWAGLEAVMRRNWMPILHLYEVPFYYIEYGISLLGAIELWRQYRLDAPGTVARFKQALTLGAAPTLPEVYAAA